MLLGRGIGSIENPAALVNCVSARVRDRAIRISAEGQTPKSAVMPITTAPTICRRSTLPEWRAGAGAHRRL
jgi:hypothetical protein